MKSFLLYLVIMWVKYSLPRIRIDHMLEFSWKFLTPLALAVMLVVAVIDKLLGAPGTLTYTLGMLIANIVIAWIALSLVRKYFKLERKRVSEARPVASPDLGRVGGD